MYKTRHRVRCRAPLTDIKHLYQLAKDLGTIKAPRRVDSGFGEYAQFIVDNKRLCTTLKNYGWGSLPSSQLDSRHVIRGLLDGGGSISRNGKGNQAKYLRIAFYSKNEELLYWIAHHLGSRKVCNDHISWTGKKAIEIGRKLYLNQSRYLARKLSALSDEIFK